MATSNNNNGSPALDLSGSGSGSGSFIENHVDAANANQVELSLDLSIGRSLTKPIHFQNSMESGENPSSELTAVVIPKEAGELVGDQIEVKGEMMATTVEGKKRKLEEMGVTEDSREMETIEGILAKDSVDVKKTCMPSSSLEGDAVKSETGGMIVGAGGEENKGKNPTSNEGGGSTATATGPPPPPAARPTFKIFRHPQIPCVSTKGNGPNGKRINGFLYKYTKTEVCICCICHGTSFTPAEFVEHAGGINIANPLRHITMIPFRLT
ncbi:ninja-family protein Os07g0602900-like [Impatiens glandulifera]|uniref:ninja-family protein Os07g0602900-like n=1 Tax=Impatiens glandulifera TaxID=253017 RepID=UPI001FB18FD8|nr:ninja-family protein Os07g0602900-like [Impatiens glandulifera]